MQHYLLIVLMCLGHYGTSQAPPFVIQYGHNDLIIDAVFTNDTDQFITAGRDNVINVWDKRTGHNIQHYSGLAGEIQSIALAKEDTVLAAALLPSQSQLQIMFIHLPTKTISYPVELPSNFGGYSLQGMEFIDSSRYLVAWNLQQIVVWDLSSNTIHKQIELSGEEKAIGTVASTLGFVTQNTDEGRLSFYSLIGNQPIRHQPLPKRISDESKLQLHPYHGMLTYQDSEARTQVMSLHSKKRLGQASLIRKNANIRWIKHEISPDQNYVSTVINYSSPITGISFQTEIEYIAEVEVVTWHLSTGEIYSRHFQPPGTNLKTRFSTQNELLVFGGSTYLPQLKLWNWREGKLIREFEGKVGKIDVLEASQEGNIIAYADIDYRTIRVLDFTTLDIQPLAHQNIQEYTIRGQSVRSPGATALALSRSGQRLVSTNWGNKIYDWDTNNNHLTQVLASADTNEIFNHVSFSIDSEQIISGSEFKIPRNRSFEEIVELHKALDTFNYLQYWVNGEKRNPYDNRLTEEDKRAKLKRWDLADGSVHDFKDLHEAIYLVRAIDGKAQIATIDYAEGVATVAWWDSESGDQIDFFPMDYHYSYSREFAIGTQGTLFARPISGGEIEIYEDNGYRFVLDDLFDANSLTFSASDKYLAVGLKNSHEISIWDIQSREKIHTLTGHWNAIQHLTFFDHDQYLVSCSTDGNMIFWDWQNEELLLYCVSLQDNEESIIVSNDNYYKSTKGGGNALVIEIDNKSYTFEQFDLKLNRPDKVLATLPNASENIVEAYYNAYQTRLRKMNFSEEMLADDYHVPNIVISSTIPTTITNDQYIDLRLFASDSRQKLDRLNIWVNDTPIYGKQGINLRPKNTQSWQQELRVALSQGKNKIQVSALNQGGAESLKETFFVTYEPREERKPDLHLISIATANHQNATYDLDFPAADAQDIAELFKQQHDRYENVYDTILIDEQVTLANVQSLKQQLLETHVDDVVIIFYAGHGVLDANYDFYLATYEMDFSAPAQGGLPYETLEDLLDGIPARQKLLLIDACHSGEVDTEYIQKVQRVNQRTDIKWRTVETDSTIAYSKIGIQNSFELMRSLFVDLRRGTGATVIASAGGVQEALESSKFGNGVFTHVLKEGIENGWADEDRDGEILVSELQEYLSRRVAEITQGLQEPTSRILNISNDFRVW